MGDDPEAFWLLNDSYLLALSGCDLPTATQEADLSGFLDDSGVVGGEMQIKEFWWRCWAPAGASFRDTLLDRLEWCQTGGARLVFGVDSGDRFSDLRFRVGKETAPSSGPFEMDGETALSPWKTLAGSERNHARRSDAATAMRSALPSVRCFTTHRIGHAWGGVCAGIRIGNRAAALANTVSTQTPRQTFQSGPHPTRSSLTAVLMMAFRLWGTLPFSQPDSATKPELPSCCH